jgi:hypothetical protein
VTEWFDITLPSDNSTGGGCEATLEGAMPLGRDLHSFTFSV